MRHVVVAVALALAGCASAPSRLERLPRDTGAPISSQVDVTAGRLAGTWAVRVAWIGEPTLVPPYPNDDLQAHRLKIDPQGQALRLTGTEAIADSDLIELTPFETTLEQVAPGRFRETGGKVLRGANLWVLWMDADDRTAAIGTPDGTFGWIIDRNATGGGDRIRAAREIMEWRGYDMALARE